MSLFELLLQHKHKLLEDLSPVIYEFMRSSSDNRYRFQLEGHLSMNFITREMFHGIAFNCFSIDGYITDYKHIVIFNSVNTLQVNKIYHKSKIYNYSDEAINEIDDIISKTIDIFSGYISAFSEFGNICEKHSTESNIELTLNSMLPQTIKSAKK